MGLITTLRERLALLGVSDGEVLHECRRCGTAFDADPKECTQCGTESIASYRSSTFQ